MFRSLWPTLLSALVYTSLIGCGGRAAPERETAVPVAVRPATAVDRADVIRTGGTVEPRESAKVSFKVAGRIARILVEEGQHVRAGQLLAELDPGDYQRGVEMAAAEADAARAQADKADAGTRKQEVAQARAAYELAADEYRRMKALYDRKSLAPADFQKVQTQHEIARQRYEEAKEGARVEDKTTAWAKAAQAEANLGLQKSRYSDTRMVSPLNGVVARRLAEAGEVIAAGMPALAIVDLDPVRVNAAVPESEIAKVRVGAAASVRVPSLGAPAFPGKVELTGYAADSQSRTFAVRVLVPNPNLALRAGMIAEAEIEGAGRVKALTLPGEAIVRDPQGATLVYVYYAEKKRVFARRVEVGRPLGTELEIRSGISASDQIVVSGQQNLHEGALVEITGGGR
ncbi:MAG TPA: efflux RND transporter periplasmic adaptor subunit [Bryobacteraceae bacterium]|nr:efflux RND transporter periplasmic adaptor subunit [Bryobacteraceae bacterium]